MKTESIDTGMTVNAVTPVNDHISTDDWTALSERAAKVIKYTPSLFIYLKEISKYAFYLQENIALLKPFNNVIRPCILHFVD